MSNNEQNMGLSTIVAFFAGFTTGAVLGLLYAPNSGAETRETVRRTSTDVKNQTVEFAHQTINAVKERVQTLGTHQDDATDNGDETTEET